METKQLTKQEQDLKNVENIINKSKSGEKLTFSERNILNIFIKRNKKK